MVYHKKLVACVKVGGKILREDGESVCVPFGSEYSILLKNLNAARVRVKVSIDSTDATEGTRLVIQPNATLELERFIHKGNLASGNRFKFIERTEKIEKHRGVKIEDGLIRIEWRKEIVRPVVHAPVRVPIYHYDHYYWPDHSPWRPYPWKVYTPDVTYTNSVQCESAAGGGFLGESSVSIASVNSASARGDVGITVPGSESDQRFYSCQDFSCESESEVIVIKLRGEIGGRKVARAVTVKHKPECQTCGKASRGGSKFCSGCGTSLAII